MTGYSYPARRKKKDPCEIPQKGGKDGTKEGNFGKVRRSRLKCISRYPVKDKAFRSWRKELSSCHSLSFIHVIGGENGGREGTWLNYFA